MSIVFRTMTSPNDDRPAPQRRAASGAEQISPGIDNVRRTQRSKNLMDFICDSVKTDQQHAKRHQALFFS